MLRHKRPQVAKFWLLRWYRAIGCGTKACHGVMAGIDGLAGETFSRDAERNNVRTSNLAVGEAWPGLVIFTTMADRQGTAAS